MTSCFQLDAHICICLYVCAVACGPLHISACNPEKVRMRKTLSVTMKIIQTFQIPKGSQSPQESRWSGLPATAPWAALWGK